MYLKRAYYDAYIQRRYIHEVELNEQNALNALAAAATGTTGTAAAIVAARAALNASDPDSNTTSFYRKRTAELASALNVTIGADVCEYSTLSMLIPSEPTTTSDDSTDRRVPPSHVTDNAGPRKSGHFAQHEYHRCCAQR